MDSPQRIKAQIWMGDWSNLPQDIWMLIAQKFSFLRDLNLFASVCVLWRDVAKDRWICGASNGWLITLDHNQKIELLNPYSKMKLQLPQRPAIQHYRSVYRSHYVRKVILTESPHSNQSCFAVSIVACQQRLAICKVGDDKWTDIESMVTGQYLDIACYRGKIFAIQYQGPLVVVDVAHDFNKITTFNAPEDPLLIKKVVLQKYLVESSGDLLLVLRVSRPMLEKLQLFTKTCGFHVYKLNESMNGWTKFKNLGDRSIFVGGSHSISAKVCGLNDCKSNCIYYLEDGSVFNNGEGCQFDCGVFCLEDGHIEPLPEQILFFWSTHGFWYVQSL